MRRAPPRGPRRERNMSLYVSTELCGTNGRHNRQNLPLISRNSCRISLGRAYRRSEEIHMSLPPPSTIIRGRTWVWPDDVNTDIIIPFRFKARTNDPVEMAKYAMYGFDPEFYKKVKPGDLFVAGRNFGGGSSREQAPVAIKYSGVAAVVAESFARIFYRNSVAIGQPALEVPGITKQVFEWDDLEVKLEDWTVKKVKDGKLFHALPVPDFLQGLMREGGLVEYYKKHKNFPWEQVRQLA